MVIDATRRLFPSRRKAATSTLASCLPNNRKLAKKSFM
jgi:hypothetical protein